MEKFEEIYNQYLDTEILNENLIILYENNKDFFDGEPYRNEDEEVVHFGMLSSIAFTFAHREQDEIAEPLLDRVIKKYKQRIAKSKSSWNYDSEKDYWFSIHSKALIKIRRQEFIHAYRLLRKIKNYESFKNDDNLHGLFKLSRYITIKKLTRVLFILGIVLFVTKMLLYHVFFINIFDYYVIGILLIITGILHQFNKSPIPNDSSIQEV